jgi:uncharacterized protein (DUF4415 family)
MGKKMGRPTKDSKPRNKNLSLRIDEDRYLFLKAQGPNVSEAICAIIDKARTQEGCANNA